MFKRVAVVALLAMFGFACATKGPSAADGVAEGSEVAEGPKDLPLDALRTIAAEIEKSVAEANREPALTETGGLIVDTPEIRQAVRTRAARLDLVKKFLDAGHAWERRNGRLWVLRTKAYKLATTGRQRDIDAIMVNSENRDRWTIYEGIIEANKLGRAALDPIEEIFFEARLQHMTEGQRYEASNGEQTAIAKAK